jgi:hypothetical protein
MDDAAKARENSISRIIRNEFEEIHPWDLRFLAAKIKSGTTLDCAVKDLITALNWPETKTPEVLAGWERRRQLEKLSGGDLQELAAKPLTEEEEEEEEDDSEGRAKENLEKNAPETTADFGYFKRHAYWTRHEAICLLLNKDPRRIGEHIVRRAAIGSPFLADYRELAEHIARAVEVNLIGDEEYIDPKRLVAWTIDAGIDVPKPLRDAYAENDDRALPSDSSQTVATTTTALELEILNLKSELKTEKSANALWRRKTLLLLGGLLHGRFTGEPKPQRASVEEVRGFIIEALSLEIDAGTIRARFEELDELPSEIDSEIEAAIKKEEKLKRKDKKKNP